MVIYVLEIGGYRQTKGLGLQSHRTTKELFMSKRFAIAFVGLKSKPLKILFFHALLRGSVYEE